MNERIKALRKALNLTQAEFGEKLGIKKSSISQIESGANSVTESNVLAICREFHVNESWLRTGEGEMFVATSRDDDIAAFVASALQGTGDNFQRRMLSVLSRLSAEEWEWIEQKAREILGENENAAQD